MKFAPKDQALSELDFHRAKADCSAPYKSAIWTGAMPIGPSAIVSGADASRENEGRRIFMDCMSQRGYICTEFCAEGLGSRSALDQKPIPSPSLTKPQTPNNVMNIAVGQLVLPAIEPMILYKEPARDAERIERLSKSNVLTVKAVAGDWVNVATESGRSGWVNGSLVSP
jgi:hypothetical protein